MSERYIEICNWERFQHKDIWRKSGGRPPWIKAYTALLHDDDWLALLPSQRGILLGLWLMYASTGKAVAMSRARSLLSPHKVSARHFLSHIEALRDAGFIEIVAQPTRAPVAPRVEKSREEPPLPPLEGGVENGHVKERVSVKGYTGCRMVRGTHGIGHVRDPLGRDRPPQDWSYEKPTREEIRQALQERAVA